MVGPKKVNFGLLSAIRGPKLLFSAAGLLPHWLFVSLRGAVALERLEFSVGAMKINLESRQWCFCRLQCSVQYVKLYSKGFGLLIVPHSDTFVVSIG